MLPIPSQYYNRPVVRAGSNPIPEVENAVLMQWMEVKGNSAFNGTPVRMPSMWYHAEQQDARTNKCSRVESRQNQSQCWP